MNPWFSLRDIEWRNVPWLLSPLVLVMGACLAAVLNLATLIDLALGEEW